MREHRIVYKFLPSLARPVSGSGLIFGGCTLVASTEGFASGRVWLFDGHIRVTETHNLCLAASPLDINGWLLWAIRSFERPVKRYFLPLVGSHYFLQLQLHLPFLCSFFSLIPSSIGCFWYFGIPRFFSRSAFGLDGFLVGFFIGFKIGQSNNVL